MVMRWDEAVPIIVITGAVREVICCLPLILAGYRLGKFNCPPHSSDDHLASLILGSDAQRLLMRQSCGMRILLMYRYYDYCIAFC